LKLLKENFGEKQDSCIGKHFLNRTPRAQEIAKTDKWDA
jgi:hypothetical protein